MTISAKKRSMPKTRGVEEMISDYREYNAGLIYVMAKALQRYSPDHVTIWQAVTWLREQRFEQEADALETSNQPTFKRT